MQRFPRTVFTIAICVLTASSLFAQAHYLLRSNGEVRVNGILVPSTAVVSPGDVIETSKGSVAKIASPGLSMLVGEDSRISVKTGTLAVDHGSASIATNSGALTGASQYSIASAGSARYQVANSGQSLSVLSMSGPLRVSGVDATTTSVPAGNLAVFSSNRSALSSASTAVLENSTASFEQFGVTNMSRVCNKKTAKECVCKTAKECAGY
jgi:hypothetical protein